MEVEFQNVIKSYGSVVAVKNLNLHIKPGAFHFLLGPSGCGKTTTLRLLAGLEPVSSGKILFSGKDVTNQPSSARGIGMVFQNYALWPHMSVLENVKYGLRLRKLTTSEIDQRVQETLELTQLGPYQHRLPSQLSGGQQQRVALARALAIRPNVLLLDEPLSNLDTQLRIDMRDNLTRIHRETKITTFYVTHDQKEALSMGTQITVMKGGYEVQTGTPKELYCDPWTSFLAGFIGETNIIEGTYARQEGAHHLVRTELGELRAEKIHGRFNNGDRVALSIRPESVHLHHTEGDNPIVLTFQHTTYLGEIEQVTFRYGADNDRSNVGSGLLKANIYDSEDNTFHSGERVNCFLSPRRIIVLPPVKGGGDQKDGHV